MKKRLKNWITSIIGGLLMLTGATMVITTYFVKMYNFSVMEYMGVFALGYVLLVAKDSILEGIFLNFLKLKK